MFSLLVRVVGELDRLQIWTRATLNFCSNHHAQTTMLTGLYRSRDPCRPLTTRPLLFSKPATPTTTSNSHYRRRRRRLDITLEPRSRNPLSIHLVFTRTPHTHTSRNSQHRVTNLPGHPLTTLAYPRSFKINKKPRLPVLRILVSTPNLNSLALVSTPHHSFTYTISFFFFFFF